MYANVATTAFEGGEGDGKGCRTKEPSTVIQKQPNRRPASVRVQSGLTELKRARAFVQEEKEGAGTNL